MGVARSDIEIQESRDQPPHEQNCSFFRTTEGFQSLCGECVARGGGVGVSVRLLLGRKSSFGDGKFHL